MLDVEMKDGVLSREIEGKKKNEAKEEAVPASSSVFATYKSYDGTLFCVIGRAEDIIHGFDVIEYVGGRGTRLLRTVAVEDGRIRNISQELYDNGRRWKKLYINSDGHYVEMIYPQEGGYEKRIFKKGFLSDDERKNKDGMRRALYHNGRLGFWLKQSREDKKRGVFEVYNEDDKLLDTVKTAFGEYYEIKFEDRDGKPVKVFRKTRGKKIVNEVIREMD
jgi:hypothetical protein